MSDHYLGFGRQGFLRYPAGAVCHFDVLFAALLMFYAPAFGVMATFIFVGPYGAPINSPGLSRHRNLLVMDSGTGYK